jgi:hypothetical protein
MDRSEHTALGAGGHRTAASNPLTVIGVLLLVPLAGSATIAHAQQSAANNALRERIANPPAVTAVAVRALEPPRIDGRLDEPAWALAEPVADFVQQDPHEGEAATEPTEVRVLYTDAALYVGVRAWDSQADQISARLTRRDVDSPSDWIMVGVDSYRDRRTAFVFTVNPAGVKRDMYLFDDNNDDESWDAVWDVGTSRDDEGWTAEFRIPFSQLRFSAAEQHEFGFQVVRLVNRLNEETHWRLMPKDQQGIVSRFGDLVGIESIRPPRRIEVLPYLSASGQYDKGEADNPFETGRNRSGRMGADLKVGVTSNLTLSATINPDFGQVEADPAVVNLSAFETFFSERRPFFNEGLDVFRFPILLGDGDNANEQLFYTRRVGRAPHGDADPRGGFADRVDQTTIRGAAKLSGKTASGWTMGLLGAVTAEEEAKVVSGTGEEFTDIVEPRTGYFVGRLARDFRNGLSQVGFFGTATTRSLPDNLTWLRSSAMAGGFDWSHRFADDTYEVGGWLVGSAVRGSAEAIDITQRSSAHYYQRPDKDHVTYDPTRTSLEGFASQFIVSKNKGRTLFATGFDTRSPGFEVNDAGFMREADRTVQFAWVGLRWNDPGKVFRRFGLNLNQHSVWSYGWERLATGGNVNANFQFLNYWGGNIGVEQELESLSPGALRGGPAFVRPHTMSAWGGFYSDNRKALSIGLHSFVFLQPASDSWGYDLSPRISWRAASNMDFMFAPGIFTQFDSWQYLTQEDALGDRRYIFGELRQTVGSMTVRGNVTFTPTLSLQLWAQPFVATGDYRGFRQVADPRGDTFADRFDDFGSDRLIDSGGEISVDLDRDGVPEIDLGNPDFTVLSFRSNLVLRWEYMLGSTVFLVWQHGRFGSSTNPEFAFGRGLKDVFKQDATNTFLVKVNYWLGR